MLLAPLVLAFPAAPLAVPFLPVPPQETGAEAPQLPPGVVAAWDGGELDATSYERFLGRSFHRKPLGQEALQHLLQIQLVQGEADRASLQISSSELDARVAEVYRQAEEGGMDLAAALAARGLDRESFRALLRDSLLHEELVRRELGMAAEEVPTPEQLEQWSARRLEELLKLSAAAPEGYALDAPPYRVSLEQLGGAIRAALPKGRQKEYLEQLVLQRHLAAWAKEHRVVLGDEILAREIEWRRRHVAENPAFGGMSYEQILQTQGSSVEAVKASDELRTAGYLRLLAAERYPDAWFEALSQEERGALEGESGEARQVRWLLLRAKAEKVDPLDLDFTEAAAELRAYRAEIASEEDFARLAEELSEHEVSRLQGGMLGWLHRFESSVDIAVCQAAFEMEAGQVSEPIAVSEGMALLFLSQVRERPDEAAFRELVRRARHQDLRKEILSSIHLVVR